MFGSGKVRERENHPPRLDPLDTVDRARAALGTSALSADKDIAHIHPSPLASRVSGGVSRHIIAAFDSPGLYRIA